MKKILFILLLLPTCLAAQTISGDYEGHIALPGLKLKVVVHLDEDDRKLSGNIDIPEQNAKGLPLGNVKLANGELSYTIADVPGNAQFTGTWKSAEDSITGKFSQNGASFPMRTRKITPKATDKPALSLFAKTQKIERYADSLLRKGEMAGMSIVIVKNGEVIFNKGFGYRDYEQKTPCDANTLFAIGSCTKAFTAALLGTLNDEGLFDWEKPIREYVPYFEMKDEFANKQINGIDICTHRSGLARYDLVWYGSSHTRRELVERVKYMEPNKPFRTTWQYNNFMFLTAGVTAEEITKKTWDELIAERFFTPLGMANSRTSFAGFNAVENKSKGYDAKDHKIFNKPYRNIDGMAPAGSICSSSTDMGQWIKLLLNKGKFNDKEIISGEQVKFLLEPKIVMPQPSEAFKQLSYAMGWMVGQYKGKTYIEHGGNIDGFTANVALMPEENIGMAVLSNKDGTSIPELLNIYIADVMLDHEEYDWYEEKIGGPRKVREAAEKLDEDKKEKKDEKAKPKKPVAAKGPMHSLDTYAGEYSDNAYGTLKVVMENKALVAKYNSLSMPMVHDKFETFNATFDEQSLKFTFSTNENGKIESLKTTMDPLAGPVTFMRKAPNYLTDEKYLAAISGDYDMQGLIMTIVKSGSTLLAKFSDGQQYELVPGGENTFNLKDIGGYSIEFMPAADGSFQKALLHQPNGDFEVPRKK